MSYEFMIPSSWISTHVRLRYHDQFVQVQKSHDTALPRALHCTLSSSVNIARLSRIHLPAMKSSTYLAGVLGALASLQSAVTLPVIFQAGGYNFHVSSNTLFSDIEKQNSIHSIRTLTNRASPSSGMGHSSWLSFRTFILARSQRAFGVRSKTRIVSS
jgi:hypothetical protein